MPKALPTPVYTKPPFLATAHAAHGAAVWWLAGVCSPVRAHIGRFDSIRAAGRRDRLRPNYWSKTPDCVYPDNQVQCDTIG